MSHQKAYSVQTKVRPYAEILEVGGSRGLQTSAIIYGDTVAEANDRAGLIAHFLAGEATPRYIRKRLRLLAWYRWFHARAAKAKRVGICHLGMWLIAAWVEPDEMGRWLAENWPSSGASRSTTHPTRRAAPTAVVQRLATVLNEEEVTYD